MTWETECLAHAESQRLRELTLLRKMAAHGGDFARALAAAWLLADPHNAACLRASFGAMLARYERAPEVLQP